MLHVLALLTALQDPAAPDAFRADPALTADRRVHVGLNFSADGSSLAVGGDGFVAVYDADLKLRAEWKHPGLVDEVVFVSGGRTLVSRGTVVDALVWDPEKAVRKKTELRTPRSDTALALASVPLVPFHDPRQGRILGDYPHKGSCPAALSPDGARLVLANAGRGFKVWDLREFAAKGEVLETDAGLETVLEHVNAIAFADRLLLLGEEDGTVTPLPLEAWDAGGAGARVDRRQHESSRRHAGPVTSLSVDPDGKLCFTAGVDGAVRLWTVESLRFGGRAEPLWTLPGRYAALSPDGLRLAVAEDAGVRIYDVASRTPLLLIPVDAALGKVVRFRWSPSAGRLAAITCACADCAPRRGEGFATVRQERHRRVHHHGGVLKVWSLGKR